MRIALFSDTYFPEINGVATHVGALKLGLEKLGHKVLVVTTNPKDNIEDTPDVLHCPSVKLKRIYGYGLSMPVNLKQFYTIKNFNPDVIHIHTEFGVGLFGIMSAKILKKPIVYTLHTIYDDYVYYVLPGPLIKTGQNVFYKYIKLLAKKASIITGPSEKSHEYLLHAGVSRHVEVIPNPVDVDEFSLEKVNINDVNDLKAKYNIPQNAFIGCVIARIGREKSIDILLRYIKKYISKNDNFYFVIVGDGPSKDELVQLSEELGLSEKVIFTGKIANHELLPYYAMADVFLTASLSDTNSISMLEAMSMGLPIIQRYDEINKDQIIEGQNGFTFNGSKEFIQKLDLIYNMSKEEREELRNKVRDCVIKKNSQLATAQKVYNVYKKAIYKNKSKKRRLYR